MAGSLTEVVQSNRQKFLKFNTIKFDRFQSLIPNQHVKRVINSIPVLLCVNNEKFPGFVSGNVPLGVAFISLDDDTKRFVKGKFQGIKTEFSFDKPIVEMMAVMGSLGTIAYNKKSDFDYWVCICKNSISNEEYLLFRKKVDLIQKWAESEIHLSVHLFVNDIESVKNNIYDEDEDEAFGSAMGALLKDEFFRSSIVVAGKTPFWWVVPQFASDTEYYNMYNQLSEEDALNFVDIGNLSKISREDFMGAALFQIIKSLGNPFKSILKLGVLEKYLHVSEDEPLISQKVKINIQRDNISNTILDSYLMMFREVYDYYEKALDDKSILNILKQNLYLKIDPQLSKYAAMKDKKSFPYKVEEMFRYTEAWGWTPEVVRELDNFDNWDFTRVMKFWDSVQKFMLLSYQKIAIKFPTMKLQNKISDSDFKLLSRKIKSHFSREFDKIDKFVSFKDTPCESILYIEPVNQGIREVEWRLFKRNSAETKTFVVTTIKMDSSLIKLLAWSALNGIYDPKFSRLTIQSGYTRINQNLVIDMLNSLSNFFSDNRVKIKNEYVVKPSFKLANFFVLNFNIAKSDTISHIVHIFHTSWGESFIREYHTLDDLATILVSMLKDALIQKKPFDDYCGVSAPEPYMKLYKDIISVIRDSYNSIVLHDQEHPVRFIAKFGTSYLMITREKEDVIGEIFPNFIRLATALTLKPKKSIKYSIGETDDPFLSTLKMILPAHDPNGITVFYEQKGDYVFSYMLNESGNLFIFFKQKVVQEQFLSYLYAFSKTIAKRIKDNAEYAMLTPERVRIQAVVVDRSGKPLLRDDTKAIAEIYFSKFGFEAAYIVFVRRGETGEPVYNFVFPDRKETGFLQTKDFALVAQKIDGYKAAGNKLRNFAQDVNFGDAAKGLIKESSIYILEKYKAEFLLDKMIKR
jgi:adenylate cyclase, class 1